MQNIRPSRNLPADARRSPTSDVVKRVVGIAPASLWPGEKEADYAMLAERLVNDSRPQDAIEEFLVRDVVDLTWDILRYRRAKAGILRTSMGVGVGRVLNSLGYPDDDEGDRLITRWVAGDDRARKKVDAILTKSRLTMDDVTAETLVGELDDFERLDRLLSVAEARRNKALREIDRHREAFAGGVRRSIEEIEDAGFRDVKTGQVTQGAEN